VSEHTTGVVPTCYRHPDTPTGIVCTRCGRPICGQCMVDASVGFQCPECVRAGMRDTRMSELPYGGRRVANPRLVTIVIIAINVVMFGLVWVRRELAEVLALTPMGTCFSAAEPGSYYPGIGAAACQAMGDGSWSPGVAGGRWWELVTSAFLHTQPWHIALNMVALWLVGQNLELVLGRGRYLALYLVSALAGSACVMWLAGPESSSLGASGAIFGLFAALALLMWRVRGNMRQLLIVMGINIAVSFMPGISWQAHLGGFLGGGLVAAILVFAPRERRAPVQWAGVAGFALVLVILIVARALMLAG